MQALGIEINAEKFPNVGNCPFCHTYELYIFTDFAVSNIWLSCRKCKKSGDIGQFAADLWNTSLPKVAKKFTDMGFITRPTARRLVPPLIRQNKLFLEAAEFWDNATLSASTVNDDDIICRMRELGLSLEVPETDGILGVAHYDTVREFCGVIGRPAPNKIRNKNYYLVIPFYDLPDRFTGFLLAQYDVNLALRTNYIALSQQRKHRPNAGYAFLNYAMREDHAQLNNTQIITNDIFWALDLQINYLKKYGVPLPVMASYDGREATSRGWTWDMCEKATRIFHSHSATPELISRAAEAHGYVSIADRPADAALRRLQDVRKETTTWSSALSGILDALPEKTALAFGRQINCRNQKVRDVLQKYFPSHFASEVPNGLGTKEYAKFSVRDDGIWDKNNARIADVKITIDTIIYVGDDMKIYAGTIATPAGTEYKFQEYEKTLLRHGLLQYANNTLRKYGEEVNYDSKWNAKILSEIISVSDPHVITAETRYGWDNKNQIFHFLEFGITADGAVVDTVHLPQNDGVAALPRPAPEKLHELQHEIQQKPEDSFIWTFVAAVAANLLAPVYDRDFQSVAICEAQFDAGRRLAKMLGCPAVTMTAVNKHDGRTAANRLNKHLVWPVFFHNIYDDVFVNVIIHKCFKRPIVAKLNSYGAAVAPSYGWCLLAPQKLPDRLPKVLPYILPAYIQYVLATKTLPPQGVNTVDYTLKSMHKWLQETTGQTFNLERALADIITPSTAHTRLRDEILHAIKTEQIDVLAYPRRAYQKQNYLLEDASTIWINKSAVDRYFTASRNTSPNWLSITHLLQTYGLHLGEKTVNKQNGFFVPKNWFFGSEFSRLNFKTG